MRSRTATGADDVITGGPLLQGLEDALSLRPEPYMESLTTLQRLRIWRKGFINWRSLAALRKTATLLNLVSHTAAAKLLEREVILRSRDGPLICTTLSDVPGPLDVFGRKEYDFTVIDWSSVKYVVDAGAHVGSFTIWACRRAGCCVAAVEPMPRSYALLSRNIAREGLSRRVTLFQAALAGSRGQRRLYLAPDSGSASLLEERSAKAFVDVSGLMAEDILAVAGYPRIDFLKMDIEGAEYEVLESLENRTLQKIRYLAAECHSAPKLDFARLAAPLQRAGFNVAVQLRSEVRLGMLIAWRS